MLVTSCVVTAYEIINLRGRRIYFGSQFEKLILLFLTQYQSSTSWGHVGENTVEHGGTPVVARNRMGVGGDSLDNLMSFH